jgi:hypothetical protein
MRPCLRKHVQLAPTRLSIPDIRVALTTTWGYLDANGTGVKLAD